jgi:DNA-binding SARP family transcriptional activator/TolB-like protein
VGVLSDRPVDSTSTRRRFPQIARMLTIRLLGGASLEGPDGPVGGRVAQRRPLALLALLAVGPAPAMSRDRLLLLLAPEAGTDRARHLLRDTVYALRAALGADAITATGDELRLNRRAVRCDVWEFRDALAAGEVEAAVALWRGPFMDGFHLRDSPEFDEWAAAARVTLLGEFANALESLAVAAADRGDAAAAATWWAHRLGLDPLNVRATLALMAALHATGNVAGAIRHAATHAALRRSELDAPPDPSVEDLAERLRLAPAPVPVTKPAAVQEPSVVQDPEVVRQQAVVAARVPRPSSARRPRLKALIVGVAVLVAAVLLLRPAVRSGDAGLDPRRVAVVPFSNATGDAALDAIGNMAADFITQGLVSTALLDVVPTTTVIGSVRSEPSFGLRQGDDTLPFRRVGEWTGAGTVVYGTYYREADELIFHARIADARAGVVLAAIEIVRTPVTSPLDGIEELRRRTLTAMGPLLDPRMSATAVLSSRPPDYAAYHEYADGLEHFVAGDLHTARRHFEAAAAADTAWTLPVLWAALARWNSGDEAGGDSLARRVAESGVRLAPLDDAILRSIQAWARGDRAAAYEAAARASRAAPGSGMAANQVAVEALRLNRPAETRRILEGLDPDHGELRGWVWYWHDLAEALHVLGRHRSELRVAGAARRRHPDDAVPRLLEVRALAALGRTRDVHSALDALWASPAADAFGAVCRASAQELAAHGRQGDVAQMVARCVEWYRQRLAVAPGDARLAGELARLLSMGGAHAEAAALLDAQPPPVPSRAAVDHAGTRALISAREGDHARADALLLAMEARALPYTAGRESWWRAAVLGARGDCGKALEVLRTGISRGVEFGMELHAANELREVRQCAGWHALVRPRG